MKITVNPPTQINSVTGEEVAVPDSQRVEYTGEPVVNEYAHGDPDNLAYESFDRKPVLRDPAFQEDATAQDVLITGGMVSNQLKKRCSTSKMST